MSKFSVKKPYTVLVGVILVIILGVVSFTKTTTDLLPSISLPYVIVVTTYPGASPETVEMAVTQPIEAGMATVSNIESISSVSSESYSMVILEFAQSTNMDSISLEIREKLDQIKAYWSDGVGNPMIMKLNPDMLPVMVAAVGMDGMDSAQVSAYVQDMILPELESVEGVASASATGLLEKSVHVVIRQEKVDLVNEKVRASIDKKLEEAQKEIEDGRVAIEDGRKELEDGEKELLDGEKELLDGEKKLEEGKKELAQKQEETLANLAVTKNQLNTAKSQLESTKVTMTMLQGVLQTLSDKLGELQAPTDPEEDNSQALNHLEALRNLRDQIVNNQLIQQAANSNPELRALLDALEALDLSDEAVIGSQDIIDLKGRVDTYLGTVKSTIITLDSSLVKVNEGLVAVEKGEITAAIEFANASSQISLGEYQMELMKGQLDAAREQMKTGQEQLEEALAQLEEGQVKLDESRESAYEQADMKNVLTVATIEGLLTAQNFSMPAGYVTEEGVDYLVRVGDKPSSVEELKKLPLMDLHMEGVEPILLGDVADVFYTDNADAIYTNVNGSAGVIVSLQKQTGYSTGDVSDRLGERFALLMEKHPGLNMIPLMDQGIYIDLVMDSIGSNILFGGFLAILILIVFLKDLRPTLIVAFSIPISLVTAMVCMYFSGVTLNVISLSGLALGIGMLVDNSIVVIENIYRLRAEGVNAKDAAIEGAKQVSGAIIASTLTTVCVFLPIVFTEGITRQLFVDMGLTIAYSLFASLLIALTVVPSLGSVMLGKAKQQKEGRLFGLLARGYEKVLAGALRCKLLVFLLALALLGISALAAVSNGTAFMGEMDSTQMTVSVQMPDSATLAETAQVTDQVVEILRQMEDVTDVGAMQNSTGSVMGIGGSGSATSTTIYVVTRQDKTTTNLDLAKQITEKTQHLPARIEVQTSNMDMSALGGSGITIQIRGRDLDTLRRMAVEVAAIVESVEGTAEVSDGLAKSGTELRIHVKKEEAVQYGLTVAQVFQQVMQKVAAANSSTVLSGEDQDYSVYVENDQDKALTRELLKEMEIAGTDENGAAVKIPLSLLASFEDTPSLESINRADQTRYVAVSANIAEGHNVGIVARAVKEKLSAYEIPAGYRMVFSGEDETINEALEQLVLMLVLALAFMYLIMVAQFQSLLSPFIIMFTIPLAFTGGFLGLYFTGSEISVIAMIGFVMLSGIIVNNGIVLIDSMNQLREEGMDRREAILTAGRTRLRPVLMTALTTILALSTMVFSTDMGSEMSRPMAIVTIGGLLYGTVLTLVVIPCIYDVFTRGRDKKRKAEVSETTAEPGEFPQEAEDLETMDASGDDLEDWEDASDSDQE